jgi:carbon-monoxide dehydrogenase large subunit
MTTEPSANGLIGASIRRVEDAVLVTVRGCYTEDIQLPRMLHLALLRSPYPHAKIISINTAAARAVPRGDGVVNGAPLPGQFYKP